MKGKIKPMRQILFTIIAAGVMLLSTGAQAASLEPEVSSNQQWAESAFSGKGNAELPFSFVYDGVNSREFIKSWKRSIKTKRLNESRIRRVLTLIDPKTGLEIKAVATIYKDTPGVDWTLHFTNTGKADSGFIEQVNAVDATFKPDSDTTSVLHRIKGSMAWTGLTMEDFMPYDEALPRGKKIEFGQTDGSSSMAVSPFFNVEWPGGGVITAIGWTGTWRATVENAADGTIRVDAGMRTMKLRLHPGETIRSPRILQIRWNGQDEQRSYNLFRRTMMKHVVPRMDGKPVVPPIAHSSSGVYETVNSTEAQIMDYLNSIKGLGFEYFWLDAWWFKGGWPNGIGNWGFPLERITDPVRFPHGVRPISDAAHQEGMKFILWMATELAKPETYLAKEHPQWMVAGLVNITIPEAREFMLRYINGAIKGFGIDVYRNDSGTWRHQLDALNKAAGPDREGIGEIRYVEALYGLWDDIIKANPHLFIDNCHGGGTRIDLEMCSRSIPLWRTDAQGVLLPKKPLESAIENQKSSAGLGRYMPLSQGGMIGSTPYLFRSGFNGGVTFCEDTRPANYPKDQLKLAIVEGKRIRKYYFADMYALTPITLSPKDWHAMQYHRPAENDGIVLAFRRNEAKDASFTCALRDIDPKADYEVCVSPTFVQGKPVVMKGSALSQFKAQVSECPGCVLVEYRKVK